VLRAHPTLIPQTWRSTSRHQVSGRCFLFVFDLALQLLVPLGTSRFQSDHNKGSNERLLDPIKAIRMGKATAESAGRTSDGRSISAIRSMAQQVEGPSTPLASARRRLNRQGSQQTDGPSTPCASARRIGRAHSKSTPCARRRCVVLSDWCSQVCCISRAPESTPFNAARHASAGHADEGSCCVCALSHLQVLNQKVDQR